jgi:hypothetical protein
MPTLTSKYWQVFIPWREIQPDVLCTASPQPTEISPKPVTDQDVQYPLGGGLRNGGDVARVLNLRGPTNTTQM